MSDEFLEGDRSNKEYWDNRVRAYLDDETTMIWATNAEFRRNYYKLIDYVLSFYKDCSVVDVACGFGRHSTIFKPENYLGFDFSDEMIRLAKQKYPKYKFEVQDYFNFEVPEVDVIFNVISVGPIGISTNQFIDKYKDKARKAVISVDGTSITIFPTK